MTGASDHPPPGRSVPAKACQGQGSLASGLQASSSTQACEAAQVGRSARCRGRRRYAGRCGGCAIDGRPPAADPRRRKRPGIGRWRTRQRPTGGSAVVCKAVGPGAVAWGQPGWRPRPRTMPGHRDGRSERHVWAVARACTCVCRGIGGSVADSGRSASAVGRRFARPAGGPGVAGTEWPSVRTTGRRRADWLTRGSRSSG